MSDFSLQKKIQKTKTKQEKKTNIFTKYFTLFSVILFVTFSVLGTTLLILINSYWQQDKTKLLIENTKSVATAAESLLIIQDMNNQYSIEKSFLCDTLSILSTSIDADVFICDVGGSVIMCKERASSKPVYGSFQACKKHSNFNMDSATLQRVYEGESVGRGIINGEEYYVVGQTIVSNGQIIGTVFATTETGTSSLVSDIMKIFILSAVLCLCVAYIGVYFLSKRMTDPLLQISTAAKQFANGDFSYRVNVHSNDEIEELAQTLNDMANALDKLEGSRRSFVANVSHELKTPMTSIAGFIDGILDGTVPKEKEKYYLKIVSDEVRRLSRLVVAMLNMSKIESGDFVMKYHNYDISEQIINILLTFEQKIEQKNIEIFGLDKLAPTKVNADPDMIYQVIYNIVDNAVKFTNVNGYISVNLKDEDNFVRVSIKNSGNGIKSEELSKIFERFYKVDKSRSLDAKGAGLGLYIVKTMVEMHGGKIWAQSKEPKSAEFIFTLPKKTSNK